ncbi:MAG: hypothetical protein LQ342_000196 [Letrouitia transgressa]|nr:MAG: hypothetical protein LQ342_000196 [Letrouitia transgressa]
MPLILDSPPTVRPSTVRASSSSLRRQVHHDADVLIVGAGIIGTALAVTFARQNRSVILLEKSLKEPDRIVGELLQPGGVQALEKLGLRSCLEDIDAVRVKGYNVIYYGEEVGIPYPVNAASEHPGDNIGGGPFEGEKIPKGNEIDIKRPEGRSFHHGRFINQLRAAALREENITVVETTVIAIIKTEYTGQVVGVETETKEGHKDVYFGQLSVLADGYASRFRKEYIRHAPISKSKFYGLELIDADLPKEMHGHVVLGDGAPVLLYQISTRETRALVDVPDGTQSTANGGVKGHLRHVVLPSLPKCVQTSFEKALDQGKLRSMPNSFLPPSTQQVPGMIMLGDAMNMRHPLTGGGMTVAFNDVVLLRELLSPQNIPDLGNTKLVQKQMRVFHWRRKNLTSVINILAQALYSLFAANDKQLKALQRGCFRYFQRGGQCIDGPVGLLAGIIRQPLVLIYHFWSVALLAMWLIIRESSLVELPLALLSSLGILWRAWGVLYPFIASELKR